MAVELRIFVEPQQGASYDDQLGMARKTEECGFAAFFRSDHFLAMGGDGLPGPSDSWVTLGALARETSRIRLGTMVTSATFRYPGPLAISVAQVDVMSGGRVDFGLGAGWFEAEHAAYGIPFPDTKERFDRLEDQLAIITGLWATPPGTTFSYEGRHYSVKDSPGLPKPFSPDGPPIIIGGHGKRRTPALAARYASEFNVGFSPVDVTADLIGRVGDACDLAGREPDSMSYSVAHTICCGRDDAEVRRRAEAIGRSVEDLRENAIAGTPAECIETIGRYAAVGTQRVYLQVLDLHDLDHLELLAAEVMPQV